MTKLEGEGPHRRSRSVTGILAVAALVMACDGDTLLDAPPDGDPDGGPVVQVVAPAGGGEVVAGERVPIRITASDPLGVSEITLVVRGEVRTTIRRSFVPPVEAAVLDTAVTVPAGAEGDLELQATAVNAEGRSSSTGTRTFAVTGEDRTPPTVELALQAPGRMEADDTIRVTVTARDNDGGTGVDMLGATVLALIGPDTVAAGRVADVASSVGTVSHTFLFPTGAFAGSFLPDTLDIRVFGFAQDRADQCAAVAAGSSAGSVACRTLQAGGEEVTVANAVASAREVVVVEGRTYATPVAGTLADLAVDTLRGRVYVSNLTGSRVHAFEAAREEWVAETLVGAQPWGLALNLAGDSLYVANSGGVSLSTIGLSGTFRENQSQRFVTQNAPLFQLNENDDDGLIRYSGIFFDFSDRPQFLAQDSERRILYSTRPTEAAAPGTVRIVERQPGWAAPESRILLVDGDVAFNDESIAIAHADSLTIFFGGAGGNDVIVIYDHRPGFPDQRVQSDPLPAEAACQNIRTRGSDVFCARGTWDRERLGFQDTTYVAASGDHRWIAFGEGRRADIGRVVMWDGAAAHVHDRLLVADLVSNASEEVRGLAMNRDGSFGAARGEMATSFFATDLRLHGSAPEPRTDGTGVTLHPDHPGSYVPSTPSSERTLAFTATGGRSIRILDTVHFTLRGEVPIRDRIVGALRSGPPLPADNDGRGRNCTGADCVVAKLYGLTDTGGVVVLDIRRRDIQPAG